jgi:hypothetical protein
MDARAVRTTNNWRSVKRRLAVLVILDLVDAFYLGTFLFGFVFAALSWMLGAAHLPIHGLKGWHSHGPPVHGPSGDVPSSHGHFRFGHGVWHAGLGLLNPSMILAFLTWFGGIGYEARHALGLITPLSVLLGLVGGLIGASIVWLFLVKVLLAQDHTMNSADYHLPGTLGRISSAIRAGGTGEVVYEQMGVRHVEAARAVGGQAMSRGSAVMISRYDRGIAWVETCVPGSDSAAAADSLNDRRTRAHPPPAA